MRTHLKKTYSSGQVVMVVVLIFLTLSLVVVIGISTPIASQVRNSSYVLQSRKSITASEVLNDDALYRLNSGRTLPSTIVLALNDSTSTAQIVDVAGKKLITVLGESGLTERSSRSQYAQASGLSISFGLQTGNGGLQMSGGPTIYGNVFSNGDIIATGGSTITGSASAAAYLSATPTISNISEGTPAVNIDVGKSNNVQLIAQSFQLTSSASITSIGVMVKKTGAPGNATLKIYNSNGSNVGTTQVGSSGTLSAGLVNGEYDLIEIYPTSPISLTGGTVYWLTLEYQGSNSNYYTFAGNNGVYADGSLKLKNKNNGNNWGSYYDASPATNDIYFNMTTGTVSKIDGINIQGNANAAVVNNSNVNGSLYCQSGSSNNKGCDDTQPLPVAIPISITSAMIQAWKDEASSGIVRNSTWDLGGSTATSTNGPMKINGNLIVGGGATLTLAGPLYVTGLLKVEGGGKIQLASGYGTGDEVIVSNTVDLGGGGQINGNGQAGSYIVVVADAVDSGSPITIKAEGGSGSMVLIAPFGTVKFSGGTGAKAVIANKMIMEGGGTLNYEAGLGSISFANGAAGAWSVETWKEI